MRVSRLILPIILCLAAGCDSEDAWDGVKTAGAIITQERPIESFHTIDLRDWIDLEIIQDTSCWLTITGPKNIIADISAEVSDDVLTISDNNRFRWVRGYDNTINMSIGVDRLKRVYLEGPASISSRNTIVGDNLTFHTKYSSGDINLSVEALKFNVILTNSYVDLHANGKVAHTHINVRGNGFVRLDSLLTLSCTANHYGGGDISLNVTEYLQGNIHGAGNILYRGNPTNTDFNYEGRGTGSFINLEGE